jgi:hypothetical protein
LITVKSNDLPRIEQLFSLQLLSTDALCFLLGVLLDSESVRSFSLLSFSLQALFSYCGAPLALSLISLFSTSALCFLLFGLLDSTSAFALCFLLSLSLQTLFSLRLLLLTSAL